VLPDYQKTGLEQSNSKLSDGGADAGGPTDTTVLAGASVECKSCVMQNCLDLMSECGADCEKIKLPVTPASEAPKTIDGFLQCMQDQCDDTCNVSWGCVERYRWPAASKAYNVTLRVIDIVASSALPDVQVTACHSSDPSCSQSSGLAGAGMTDLGAHATLGVPQDFVGYFLLKGADGYMPAVALWTQPAYRLTEGFTQRMMQWGVAEALAVGTDSKLRREASHLIFQAQNCLPLRYLGGTQLHSEADDVAVTFTPPASDSSRVFYTGVGASIDRTLTGTAAVGGAFGGAFNLPSQTVTVIASHAGQEVSRAAIQMRPGTVGFVYLVPNAR
jgi:hypothetical protein